MKSQLFLQIVHDPDAKGRVKEDYYALERLAVDNPGRIKLAWRLRKPDAEPHTVMVFTDGRVSCDCPSFTFDKQGKGEICKHLKSLTEAWLLPRKRNGDQ